MTRQLKGMAQLGQDLWVAAMCGARQGGFVDIGAFDGVDISNSSRLHKQLGWRGVLVEPNPELFAAVCVNRTGDHLRRVQRAVLGGEEQVLDFVPAGVLGTISGFEDSDHHSPTRQQFSERTIQVRITSPTDLLAGSDVPPMIDVMSIDTEGAEWNIVSHLDYDRWRVARGAWRCSRSSTTTCTSRVPRSRGCWASWATAASLACTTTCSGTPIIWRCWNGSVQVDYDRVNASFTRPQRFGGNFDSGAGGVSSSLRSWLGWGSLRMHSA